VNLGNLSFLRKNHERAEESYRNVLQHDPDSHVALLGLARVQYAQEKYDSARGTYNRLSSVSPKLAGRFSYLGNQEAGKSRASGITLIHSSMLWEE
jgi:Tfp pilus assembly protein PilF